ncbi:MAG: tRNA dihydrouridine synthase DusB [Candidatus Sumerlaeota bacterium]|nr:tRNA dihydrouridine synthase DusB [Candidatus Sumerlaeota bacterium]
MENRIGMHGDNGKPSGIAWHIGRLKLASRVMPAPLCDISDRPFRELARSMGADLVCTQMLSAEGIVRDDKRTWSILDTAGEASPVSVQLLGANPDTLARAAQMLEARGASIIDLNMGCPARKITGNRCGSALMLHPGLVAAIVKTVKRAIAIPLTVKMRAGWDDSAQTGMEIAQICESEGVDAVTIHARTRQQAYKGRADWGLISGIKAALRIPVIGNGDIMSPPDAVRMIRQTGCDAIMIGRGLMGNPWLMRACNDAVNRFIEGRIADESQAPGDEQVLLDDGTCRVPVRVPFYMKEVTLGERFNLVLWHTRMMVAAKGERRGVLEMRKHSQHYIKGIRGCKLLREKLMKLETLEEIGALFDEYRRWLAGGAGTMQDVRIVTN